MRKLPTVESYETPAAKALSSRAFADPILTIIKLGIFGPKMVQKSRIRRSNTYSESFLHKFRNFLPFRGRNSETGDF